MVGDDVMRRIDAIEAALKSLADNRATEQELLRVTDLRKDDWQRERALEQRFHETYKELEALKVELWGALKCKSLRAMRRHLRAALRVASDKRDDASL